MAVYDLEQYRNIVLVGHGGAGKTTLAEALMFKAGVTNRLGSVPDKTSILDCTDEAKEKGGSIDSSVCYATHKGMHLNMIDTPGTNAFCGPAIAALAAAECAVLVVSAVGGIEVRTRKMWERAKAYGLGVWIVVSKIDAPNVNLAELVGQLQELFGSECVPINLPTGGGKDVIDCFANDSGDADFSSVADANTAVVEAIVGADDDLMEEYLGGEVSKDELRAAAAKAVAEGAFVPVFFANAREDVGITNLLDAFETFCPSPVAGKKRCLAAEEVETEIDPKDDKFIGQIFKVTSDQKSGIKYVTLRVHSGKLTSDMSLKTEEERKGLRPGQIQRSQGGEHEELEAGVAGDIISLAKLDLNVGDTVYAESSGKIAMPKFPEPMFALALEPKSRGDADKIVGALRRFTDEDPCLKSERTAAGELVLKGMDDTHLRAVLHRMEVHHKLPVNTKPPKTPYRETVAGRADHVEYTHKKQTGGAGQFARVFINLFPSERGSGYQFVDKIFGGSIDQGFRPSVDKGVRSQMREGVIAGYPVVDVTVELVDGKTHPVDSKDIAFQIAGRGVFKDAFLKAKPILLEPIVNLEVTVPTDKVGDMQGDLASRRGRPVGQDMLPGNLTTIRAVVPMAEITDYNSRLSSITGGQGSYAVEFSHYEPVPGNVQQQIIDQAKKEREEARAS